MSDLEQKIADGVSQALEKRGRRRYDGFMMLVVAIVALYLIGKYING